MSPPLIATYRVQLNAAFGFEDAASIAPYLAELGVSHLYCSPYLQAAPGSAHGYDVVDHSRVNVELGGDEGHTRLCEGLRAAGLGQVLDIVPNHMAIGGRENRWWWDVLERGPASPYALHFDVDWDPPDGRHDNRVLLPVLGDHYGRALEAGAIRLERDDASFHFTYGGQRWPVSLRSLRALLAEAARRFASTDLAYVADALAGNGNHRETETLGDQLQDILQKDPVVAAALDAVVEDANDHPETLDAIHERQHYRLAFWRAAQRELGYRRFFDINSLVGIRTENEHVFAETHALVLDWARQGAVHGLRIDHPDGLRDPQGYLERLRCAAPETWIVVEKVLEPGERLPEAWPVSGTTGYDFLNVAGGLFVDPAGEEPLTALYREFTAPLSHSDPELRVHAERSRREGEESRRGDVAGLDYPSMVLEKKRLVLREVLGSDVNRLAALFQEVCEGHRRYRDYTRGELEDALREVAACLPVYRTYVQAEQSQVSESDAHYIEHAIEAARAARPDLDPDLLAFLRDILLLRVPGALEGELAMRFQQLTGSVMAKGVEDTAFYCYNRLVSLNEVGGDPGRFGTSPQEFHRYCQEVQRSRPLTMLATSTHDTKRSEDVRARLSLLSEIPEAWADAVGRWAAMNQPHRAGEFPDRNTEYLFYQTLVGAWPISTQRMLPYMEKAAREAKAHTAWTRRDGRYEEVLARFVEGTMGDSGFLADVAQFVAPLVEPGRTASLGQTLLKLTAPGVPDLYQGAELWDLSLVDPDNRRPVDFGLRRKLLAELKGLSPEEVLARSDDGLPKLLVIQRALALRRRCPQLFGPQGSYEPLDATGRRAGHVVAFCRGGGAVTIVPRLVLGLREGWEDTALSLPTGTWRNELTGDAVLAGSAYLRDLLARFPVALLSRRDAP